MSVKRPVLLIVDDEIINQMVIADLLAQFDYELVIVGSGEEAWDRLKVDPEKFDAVLLDRLMPGIDGMEVLKRIKQDKLLKLLPVIMQTAASDPEQVAEGLSAGAFYYLTKPYNPAVMRAVVSTALRDRYVRLQESLDSEYRLLAMQQLNEASFNFRDTDGARHIALLLSCLCPVKETAHMGLMELMLNAIEHGNLGITYDEKTHFIAEDQLHGEIRRRLVMPEYAGRIASAEFRREGSHLMFTIRDQGLGFDWQPFLEMSIERMMDNHGRGIAMSRSIAFEHLEYQGCGNCVVATINAASCSGHG